MLLIPHFGRYTLTFFILKYPIYNTFFFCSVYKCIYLPCTIYKIYFTEMAKFF